MVDGPATALQAIGEAFEVQQGIVLCGFGMLALFLAALWAFLSWQVSSVLTAEVKLVKCLALRC